MRKYTFQNGGDTDIFHRYIDALENLTNEYYSEDDNINVNENNEFEDSETSEDNNMEILNFANKIKEIEDSYTARLDSINENLMALEMINSSYFSDFLSQSHDFNKLPEEDNHNYSYGKLKEKKAFIIHHTGLRGSVDDIKKVFRERGVSTQYIIDREGNIHTVTPEGSKGRHIRSGKGIGAGLNNSNTEGVEIIANDDSDILPVQQEAALALIKRLNYKPNQVFGHGEINTHKQKTEGQTVKKYILQHYNN